MFGRHVADPIASDHKRPSTTAKHLVHQVLLSVRFGETVSIKETIAAVRKLGPDLGETDCQLVKIIVSDAVVIGAFVAFDLHE